MANLQKLSDEQLKDQYQKLLSKKQDLSNLSNENLKSQYQNLLSNQQPQMKSIFYRAPVAEAQALGNIVQNIGKSTGLISKEAEPWKIREALGVKTKPTGYEKFVTGATEALMPFALPELGLAKGAGFVSNIINRGTLPSLYYLGQGQSPLGSALEGYGGAALTGAVGPALKGLKKIGGQAVGSVKELYATAKNLPKYEQELQQLGKIENNLANKLEPTYFDPVEQRPLTHEENIFRMTADKLKELQKKLGSKYEEFKEKHSGKEIKIGIQKSAQQIIDELPKPTNSELFGVNAKSAEQLGHEINAQIVPVTKEVNSIFDNYRSMRKYAQRALNKAYAKDSGLSPDEVNELKDIAKSYNAQADKLENLLTENNYGSSVKELKKINEAYANEYAPIYRTNIYWNMLNSGKTPDNFLNQITGQTEGRKIFRNIVRNNPELRKAAIAEHATTPAGFLDKNKKVVLEPYLKEEPELLQSVNNYKEALKKQPEIKKSIEKSKNIRKYALSLAKGAGTGAATVAGGMTTLDLLKR